MLENVQAVLNRINSIKNKIGDIRKTSSNVSIMNKNIKKNLGTKKSFSEQLEKKVNNLTQKDKIDNKIEKYSKEFNIDPKLIRSVIQVESGFDPSAHSSKGAMGLMQLMPNTASELGVKDAFNIDENIKGGVSYLSRLVKDHSSLEEALAAYNAGPGAVAQHNGVPPYKETKEYIKKIMEIYNNGQ